MYLKGKKHHHVFSKKLADFLVLKGHEIITITKHYITGKPFSIFDYNEEFQNHLDEYTALHNKNS